MEKLDLEFDSNYQGYKKDLFYLKMTNLLSQFGVGLMFLAVGCYYCFIKNTSGIFLKIIGYIMMAIAVFCIIVIPLFYINYNIYHGVVGNVKISLEKIVGRWKVTYYVKVKGSEIEGKFTETIDKIIYSQKFVEIYHNSKVTYIPFAVLSEEQKNTITLICSEIPVKNKTVV